MGTAEVKEPKSKHDQLMDLLCEIGSLLGYDRVESRFFEENMEYDVVWWKKPRKTPTHVFEIQLKGNLYQALSKLKHAYDIWGSKVFLVATKSDIAKAEKLVAGSFHEIKDKIVFLEPKAICEFYEFKKRFLGIQMAFETIP